ncbi:general substrate transporter [Coccomyxa subellipsoidea C-169]|uniref:General substrate transporter n=1 Tax=Coccomyxa subellipsoidea (strain C-169) TaxID=574566 RepID=I0YNX5_COCSC|nr:general substrate transporter [Coccomyxa subellipsoidea C-169]EIE20094.1 general substrate transporter [Coccomyxa subellipsoidea C-169]|eukprot:XP_005644638.1 general substrate transporter [Coccomyxa subellipsoidea C-169]
MHKVSRRGNGPSPKVLDPSAGLEMANTSTGSAPATERAALLEGETNSNPTAVRSAPSWLSPRGYVWLLTLICGTGGFLFGYDTGVISGALPYMQDDVMLSWIQGTIVSAAVAGAAGGSALGGALSDFLGRKKALMAGDVLFTVGALLMSAAPDVSVIIAGRALVGIGVGLASVTVPVYIAESAPAEVRATLVTVNVFMITSGQFVAYLADYLFTFVPGTWRWMLGVAAVPALLQMVGLLFLPESPRWLLAHGRQEEGRAALEKLVASADVDKEAADISAQVDSDRAARISVWAALGTPELRAQLHIGVGLQVLQQLAGINTVMYYTPVILELAGLHDKRTALLVAMAPAAVNALGTVVGMVAIDRCGRRKLLQSSLCAVTLALLLLGGAFKVSELHAPPVAPGGSCPAAAAATCTQCIRQGCDFCGPAADVAAPGVCVARGDGCPSGPPDGPPAYFPYTAGCPSGFMPLILGGLLVYLAAFSPGLGPVPWAINAEIYSPQARPSKPPNIPTTGGTTDYLVRGFACGVAATANWLTNALVAQTFLMLTGTLGGSGTFWLYAAIAAAGTVWAHFAVVETQGLSLEEVQEMFKARTKRRRAGSQQRLQP